MQEEGGTISRVVWLDIKNAFGFVSQEVMWTMMGRLGIPHKFTRLCKAVYESNWAGYTRRIPLRVGIKQGCPLSPLLCNLAMEGLLPALTALDSGVTVKNGTKVKHLVYADDLCILGSSKQEVKNSLEVVKLPTGQD